MQRAHYDIAGHHFVPSEGVTLASLGVPPYSPPAEDWEDGYPGSSGSADRFGPADISRFDAIPSIAPGMEAPGGRSFADMVRTTSPAAEPGAWREDDSTPRYAGWHDPAGHAVPYDPRAVALGAVRIPGLPEDAAGWELREKFPVGDNELSPVQLAQLGLLKELGKLGFSLKNRLLLRKPPEGSIFRSGGWSDKDLTPRYDKKEKTLSGRTSLSNPYPTPLGGQPVFREGKYYLEIDSSKLPWGSAYVDNRPSGHVTIWPMDLEVLRKAIIKRDKLR